MFYKIVTLKLYIKTELVGLNKPLHNFYYLFYASFFGPASCMSEFTRPLYYTLIIFNILKHYPFIFKQIFPFKKSKQKRNQNLHF